MRGGLAPGESTVLRVRGRGSSTASHRVGDMVATIEPGGIGAFACFAPECIARIVRPLDNSAHHAAALALKKAMPDCHMELVRILEIDDEIYVTGRFKGTHTGDLYTPLGPVSASGKGLDLLFVDYFRVANKKIVECEVVRDRLGMMIQLGVLPAM